MSAWDSDDDLLNDLNGDFGAGSATAAFKDEEDLDEDALLQEEEDTEHAVLEGRALGSSDGEDSIGDPKTDLNSEQQMPELDEHESETGEQLAVEESTEPAEELAEPAEEELDYEDDMIELEVTGDDGLGLEEFGEFEESAHIQPTEQLNQSVDSSVAETKEQVEPEQKVVETEATNDVEESQEDEEESDREEEGKKEEEEEDDNEEDEDGESERGRFKTERKDEEISKIRTVSSNKNNIPDKLELSVEQQEEINKFHEDKNKRFQQRGPRGRGGRGSGGYPQRGGPVMGGLIRGPMGGGIVPRHHFQSGSFQPQINLPVPQPKKILINPNFRGTIQAQQNILLNEIRPQIPGMPMARAHDSGIQIPGAHEPHSLMQQINSAQHNFQRPMVSWSGPVRPLIQQPIQNQQHFQQQGVPNLFVQGRPQINMSLHHQGPPLQQQAPPRLIQQNRFRENMQQHNNQMGDQSNRMMLSQQQPRIHWEGNHGSQNMPPGNQGPQIKFGVPQHNTNHMQQRPSIRFGEPVRHQIRHQELAGQPIQTIGTVVGNQRRQQQPPRQPFPVGNQQTNQQQPINRPQQQQPSPNQPRPTLQLRRSVKDRLGQRPVPTEHGPSGGAGPSGALRSPVKRKSLGQTSPTPAKTARTQSGPVDENEYKRKLEEQKKVREKIKAMKEKKRQEAAESRRQDLMKRLADEGKTLQDVGAQLTPTPQQQPQRPAVPSRQGIYINQQGKQVVRMSRAQHDQMVQQGLAAQGQMPIQMLRAPGSQQIRQPNFLQGQSPNRFPEPTQPISPPLGRGANMQSARGCAGRGRGLAPGPASPLGVGRGRGGLSQHEVGNAPIASLGRGVKRTLRQVNTSPNVQFQTAPPLKITRQVLPLGSAPKVVPKTVAGRGKSLASAKGQSAVSRLGPPPNASPKGRGRGLTGAVRPVQVKQPGVQPKGRGANLGMKKPVGMITRSVVGAAGDGLSEPVDTGPVTVRISGIPAGAIPTIIALIRKTSPKYTGLEMNQIEKTLTVVFPSLSVATKFRNDNDRRMINMGLIHVAIEG